MIFGVFDYQVILDNAPLLIKGLQTTLILCILGNVLSIVIGTILGVAKVSKVKFVSYLASAYIEIFRNTPLLVQVYFFYYGVGMAPFIAGLSGLCTYTSAYMAEVIRAGIQSIPEVELKAADALGISSFNKIRRIVLPQAFRIIIPPMSSQLMNLTKNTSIVYFISVTDITGVFEVLSGQTFKFFEFFVVVAFTYMFICWMIALSSYYVERYLYVPGLSSVEVETEH